MQKCWEKVNEIKGPEFLWFSGRRVDLIKLVFDKLRTHAVLFCNH